MAKTVNYISFYVNYVMQYMKRCRIEIVLLCRKIMFFQSYESAVYSDVKRVSLEVAHNGSECFTLIAMGNMQIRIPNEPQCEPNSYPTKVYKARFH